MELAHLGRVQVVLGIHQRVRGTPDGGEGRPQLVADHPQELGPQPSQLLQRRHVLHGDDYGLDAAVLRWNGRSVDDGGDSAPVGDLEHDLLGPNSLPGAERLGQGEIPKGNLPPNGPPDGQRRQQILRRLVGVAQAVDDPSRLPVERYRRSSPGVEKEEEGRDMSELVREALRLYMEERELRRQERLERLRSRQATKPEDEGGESND